MIGENSHTAHLEFPASKRAGPHPWGVTFGDLLTLVLCFFLSLVPRALSQKSGTPIAQSTSVTALQAGAQSVSFAAGDFADETAELSESEANYLKELLKVPGYEVSLVTVRSCLSEQLPVSISRALSVLRQISDAGIPGELLRVETEAGGCDPGQAVAVKVQFRRISPNG